MSEIICVNCGTTEDIDRIMELGLDWAPSVYSVDRDEEIGSICPRCADILGVAAGDDGLILPAGTVFPAPVPRKAPVLSWVSLGEVYQSFGPFEYREGGVVAVEGGPRGAIRTVMAHLQVFRPHDRGFAGIAFDGQFYSAAEICENVTAMVRDLEENPDLFVDGYFAADGSLAGYHVCPIPSGL